MKFLHEILTREAILVDSEFSEFFDDIELLTEAKDEKKGKLTHLDHVEDLLIRHPDGLSKASEFLTHTHNFLSGKKNDKFNLTTKMDGSPSLVWGHHPENKKFFVGTKAFFNKTPKINFSDKDIDANHGKSPGLVKKLKNALKHLKSVTPKEGVYQGDMMYAAEDVGVANNTHYSFSPNTLSYHVHKGSAEGKKIADSKIGIAPHTTYEPDMDGSLKAKFKFDHSQFKDSPDVHLFNTKVGGNFYYPADSQKKFSDSLDKARKVFSKIPDHEPIRNHEKVLLAYINDAVKNRKENTVSGYISFMRKQMNSKMEDLKTDSGKTGLKSNLSTEIKNVLDHEDTFKSLFSAHKHLQGAKNVLVDALSHKSPYDETILGNKSKPEGFVASVNHEPVKLVDRNHFSSANFDWNEKVNPSDNPTVLVWGRFNPPTEAHRKLIDQGGKIATKTGGKLSVVASGSKGNPKNPLTPADKLKWLKTMFPKADVSVAGLDKPTLIAQLQHMHSSGVRHLTIMAGSDRVPDYEKLVAKYNGPEPGKMFHFSKIRIVSGGDRDPESKEIGGVSASKQRRAVAANDFATFRKNAPSNLDDNKVKRMFVTMRTAIKQGPDKK